MSILRLVSCAGLRSRPRSLKKLYIIIVYAIMLYKGVKRRWYVLKDGVFSWWTPEDKDIAVSTYLPILIMLTPHQPPNGSQSMSTVVEILDYSTAANVQALMQHSFLIACADGKKYQLGVSDDVTKQKWVVALTAAQIEATMQRTAYRLSSFYAMAVIVL